MTPSATVPTASGRSISFMHASIVDYTMDELLEEIEAGARAMDRRVLAHHNLHSLYLIQRNSRFRDFYKHHVRCAPIDGMPLIWIARLYGHKVSRDRRLTYVDFLPRMLDLANAGKWRIFYLGSRPDVCQEGLEAITFLYPQIVFRAAHGYFDMTPGSDENRQRTEEINGFRPHVLLVGMGMPRQEEWIAANLAVLAAGVILPCGAAIDYIAGAIPTPPRWSGRLGLEWLFRLAAEPRRLARRYLVEPWSLLFILLSDLSRRS